MSELATAPDVRAPLGECYSIIGALWSSAADVDVAGARNEAAGIVEWLADVNPQAALPLSRFLHEAPISDEAYIDLFELDPQCALYLGSHAFDEPKTCAGAGVSDRNDYMIELVGVYRHFGHAPNANELPDYLPLMAEFLAMTVESADDPVRGKFINDYLLPYLPPLRARLEEIGTPYLHLLDALERVIRHDITAGANERSRVSHVE